MKSDREKSENTLVDISELDHEAKYEYAQATDDSQKPIIAMFSRKQAHPTPEDYSFETGA